MSFTIIGFSCYGKEMFQSPTASLKNFYYLELKDLIVDEIHIRDKTNFHVSEVNVINDDLDQGTIS